MTVTGSDLVTYTQGQVPAGKVADDLVAGALGVVRSYCGWMPLGRRSETLTLDGSGTQEQQLPATHVVEVQAVREDGELLPASAYSWSSAGLLRRRVGCWSDEYRAIEVEATIGYEAGEADDVRGVVLALAARVSTNPFGLTSQAVGAMSFGYDSMLAGEMAKLDPYRAVVD
ncbi:head-to-tail adaptor [Gordonia phage Dardanus]|uniref:Head-to-tail adaptor n=1 Tax=Gordonia phage Dardanus TaxID=2588489 RepID=A0A514CX27_9CAUD|nr:head-to-tail adaptor [Gordonia phage Dardanus]QDH85051.1 head-to-tail adaptor [Gordonia phage Dardanus]